MKINIMSGKEFGRKIRIAGKKAELKQWSINRYPHKDISVGNKFFSVGYTPPWYISSLRSFKNWIWQSWVAFYEDDYFLIKNYRVFGIRLSVLHNLRIFRGWQKNTTCRSLYGFRPKSFGPLSFYVIAWSKQEAIKKVDRWVKKHRDTEPDYPNNVINGKIGEIELEGTYDVSYGDDVLINLNQ